MDKNETIRLLQSHKQTLAERFGVTSLAVFGSFARDEATGDSDLDVRSRSTALQRPGRTSGCSSTSKT